MDNKTHHSALAILSRRDHAVFELKQKLYKKGHPPDQVETVIAALQRVGLLNDDQFAINFINYKLRQGWGPQRIAYTLAQQGIQRTIEEIVSIADNAWLTAIQNVWQKRFKGKMPMTFKERAQQIRFLTYRGFTREQIAKLFDAEF